jgi:hypothetical protein
MSVGARGDGMVVRRTLYFRGRAGVLQIRAHVGGSRWC